MSRLDSDSLTLSSGFNNDDRWGHRAGEPNKAVICSIALARLRTADPRDQNSSAVGMAQKLLLFWRKPARRCWWEGIDLENVEGVEGTLKVWIRRVWTLEMVSVIYTCCPRRSRNTNLHPERYWPSLTRAVLLASLHLLPFLSCSYSPPHLLFQTYTHSAQLGAVSTNPDMRKAPLLVISDTCPHSRPDRFLQVGRKQKKPQNIKTKKRPKRASE